MRHPLSACALPSFVGEACRIAARRYIEAILLLYVAPLNRNGLFGEEKEIAKSQSSRAERAPSYGRLDHARP